MWRSVRELTLTWCASSKSSDSHSSPSATTPSCSSSYLSVSSASRCAQKSLKSPPNSRLFIPYQEKCHFSYSQEFLRPHRASREFWDQEMHQRMVGSFMKHMSKHLCLINYLNSAELLLISFLWKIIHFCSPDEIRAKIILFYQITVANNSYYVIFLLPFIVLSVEFYFTALYMTSPFSITCIPFYRHIMACAVLFYLFIYLFSFILSSLICLVLLLWLYAFMLIGYPWQYDFLLCL